MPPKHFDILVYTMQIASWNTQDYYGDEGSLHPAQRLGQVCGDTHGGCVHCRTFCPSGCWLPGHFFFFVRWFTACSSSRAPEWGSNYAKAQGKGHDLFQQTAVRSFAQRTRTGQSWRFKSSGWYPAWEMFSWASVACWKSGWKR